MGLNLHYIPLKERFMLMNRLMMFKTNQKMDETTRIRYSYEMIRLIPASDWGTAMMVPAEHFRKAPIEKVWADSRKIARK
jgi:hypothetical protein